MSRAVGIVVLGSTGSVGRQTLDVIRAWPDRFQVIGLAAGRSVEGLAEQIREFKPSFAALADVRAAAELQAALGPDAGVEVWSGDEAAGRLAALPEVSTVVAAVVGQAGLKGVWAAVGAGKRVALANKESLVMAGELVMARARAHGASILPVDSEHASLAQVLAGVEPAHLRRVILTASGGPFLSLSVEELATVRAEDALAHPNWDMGAKISVDSATMMNKGFEVIEAHWLFDLALQHIDVLVHPESLVHALAELRDGSVLASLGPADMRIPIASAIAAPERLDLVTELDGFSLLDLAAAGQLRFLAPDEDRFAALPLCRRAAAMGGGAAAALSVADEVAVEAFLSGRLRFLGIVRVLSGVLDKLDGRPLVDLDDVFAAGEQGRQLALAAIEEEEPTSQAPSL